MELFLIAAVALMVLGVIGSLTPMVPGALLSISGIIVYWHGTGYTRPDSIFLAAFMLTGLFAVATDYLAGIVSAKIGGASNRTSIAAGIAGLLLFFVLGPIGILVGVVGVVFAREFLRTDDFGGSLKSAVYSGIGVLGSSVVQFVITVSLLIAFLIALVV